MPDSPRSEIQQQKQLILGTLPSSHTLAIINPPDCIVANNDSVVIGLRIKGRACDRAQTGSLAFHRSGRIATSSELGLFCLQRKPVVNLGATTDQRIARGQRFVRRDGRFESGAIALDFDELYDLAVLATSHDRRFVPSR